jgi:hypothetical protein
MLRGVSSQFSPTGFQPKFSGTQPFNSLHALYGLPLQAFSMRGTLS